MLEDLIMIFSLPDLCENLSAIASVLDGIFSTVQFGWLYIFDHFLYTSFSWMMHIAYS